MNDWMEFTADFAAAPLISNPSSLTILGRAMAYLRLEARALPAGRCRPPDLPGLGLRTSFFLTTAAIFTSGFEGSTGFGSGATGALIAGWYSIGFRGA